MKQDSVFLSDFFAAISSSDREIPINNQTQVYINLYF